MEDSSGNGRVQAATGTSTEPNQSSKAHETEADKWQEKLQSPEICTLKKHISQVYWTDLLHHAPFHPHSFIGLSKKDKRLWRRKNFKLAHSCGTPKLSFKALTYYLCYSKIKKTTHKSTNKLQSKMQTPSHQQLHSENPILLFKNPTVVTCKMWKTLTSPIQICATVVISRLYVLLHKLIREGKTDAVCSHISFWNNSNKEKQQNITIAFIFFFSPTPLLRSILLSI